MTWVAVQISSSLVLSLAALGPNQESAGAELPAPPGIEGLERLDPDPQAAAFIAELIEAARARPTDAAARAKLAMAYHGYKLLNLAVPTYRQALSLDPSNARWWYQLARALDEIGEAEASLEAIGKALALAPNYAPAHTRMGFWLYDLGRLDEAKRSFDTALRWDPAYRNARLGLARIQLQNGALEPAVRALETLRATDPSDTYVSYLVGVAYRRLGYTQKAEAELSRGAGSRLSWKGQDRWQDTWAAEVQGLQVGWRRELARAKAYLALGKTREAIAILEPLREAQPDAASLTDYLAMAYAGAHQFDRALELLEAAVREHPDRHWHLLNIGLVYERMGQLDDAIRHTEEAIRVNPALAAAHIQRGKQLLLAERPKEALSSFETARRYDPSRAQTWVDVGRAQHGLGQIDEAAATFERATERFPHLASAYYFLAVERAELGHLEEATVALDALLILDVDPKLAAAATDLRNRLRTANSDQD